MSDRKEEIINKQLIMLIRHAEKPGLPGTEYEFEGSNLSARGYTRAEGIGLQADDVFNLGIASVKEIDYIFATMPTKHSVRPLETITPLSSRAKKVVNTKYSDGDYLKLAKKLTTDAKYKDKTIVICWHHGTLPELIKALGGNASVVPQSTAKNSDSAVKWDEEVFDKIIVIDYVSKTTTIRNQSLLIGDSY